MAAKGIRSRAIPISIEANLAEGDDLDGVATDAKSFDITGAQRVILLQKADTLGTAGIDVVEISHDGENWEADLSIVSTASNDFTGNIAAAGALNAAGVEPPANSSGLFRGGPYEGPTYMRVVRKTTDTAGTTWVTGAPDVWVVAIGGNHNGGALTALA